MLVFFILFLFSFHLKEELLKNDSVKIFIIDSKVEAEYLNSPALKINPDSSHGSKVAAVIRSQSRADIKAFSAQNIIGRIDKDNYLAALREVKNYAILNPREKIVVNISLGFEEKEFQEEIIREITELENIILVAAAGNNNSPEISYPARFEKVAAAAALEGEAKMAASNYGKEIDFAASGIIEITQRYFLPALNYSRKYKLSGTSFAAPQISALTADILSINPKLKIEDALAIIRSNSNKLDNAFFEENKLGAGRIDRFASLSKANPYYFWLQLAVYTLLGATALMLLYLCWQKYSFSGIFIFLIISAAVILIQPLLMLLYYQFGLFKIMFFFLSLGAVYVIFFKLLQFYLNYSNNFSLLLKIGPYLNQKLQQQLIEKSKRPLTSNNKEKQQLEKSIRAAVSKSYSPKKIGFYLKLAVILEQPPVSLIVDKSLNYGISAEIIASNFKLFNNGQKQQYILNAELLAVIFNGDYTKKKKAAEIAAEFNSALILTPLKNIILKRKQLQLNNSILYFLLDIVESSAEKAADFSPLLKEIITQESDPWLKYHSLMAYQNTAVKDKNYQEFIKKIRKKEKEPVLLALKDQSV